ncbi:11805_t:CDS:2 [Entrophospora sp. SA101]|nr:11805_t:CDS:2 [Entrophospora sp. SA101]
MVSPFYNSDYSYHLHQTDDNCNNNNANNNICVKQQQQEQSFDYSYIQPFINEKLAAAAFVAKLYQPYVYPATTTISTATTGDSNTDATVIDNTSNNVVDFDLIINSGNLQSVQQNDIAVTAATDASAIYANPDDFYNYNEMPTSTTTNDSCDLTFGDNNSTRTPSPVPNTAPSSPLYFSTLTDHFNQKINEENHLNNINHQLINDGLSYIPTLSSYQASLKFDYFTTPHISSSSAHSYYIKSSPSSFDQQHPNQYSSNQNNNFNASEYCNPNSISTTSSLPSSPYNATTTEIIANVTNCSPVVAFTDDQKNNKRRRSKCRTLSNPPCLKSQPLTPVLSSDSHATFTTTSPSSPTSPSLSIHQNLITDNVMRPNNVHQYSSTSGEKKVMILTSKVAQKSYGTEKRFLCPPPTTMILGEQTNQQGILEWISPSGNSLDPTSTCSEMNFSGKCVSKHLYISDADEKRKKVEVLVNIQSPMGDNIGTFASKPIKVISKPSKKRQSAKNMELCIHHGSTVSLFNRIRSQTVSTKYLGVSTQQNANQTSGSCNYPNGTYLACLGDVVGMQRANDGRQIIISTTSTPTPTSASTTINDISPPAWSGAAADVLTENIKVGRKRRVSSPAAVMRPSSTNSNKRRRVNSLSGVASEVDLARLASNTNKNSGALWTEDVTDAAMLPYHYKKLSSYFDNKLTMNRTDCDPSGLFNNDDEFDDRDTSELFNDEFDDCSTSGLFNDEFDDCSTSGLFNDELDDR